MIDLRLIKFYRDNRSAWFRSVDLRENKPDFLKIWVEAAANIKSEGSTGTGSNQSDGSPSAGRHSPVSPPACGAGIDNNPN